MSNTVNAKRTLAQAGAWLLDQDGDGRLQLRGPGHLDGIDLSGSVTVIRVDHRATVTTANTVVEIEVPERHAPRLRKLVELIDRPPAPIHLPDETMTPAVPLGTSLLVCPHCQTRGRVTTRRTRVKRGVSGGKATGAILTGGWSLLATGLARKESVTQANCAACSSTWQF
jgi:hypothetical protein